jgi:hypothetical protein
LFLIGALALRRKSSSRLRDGGWAKPAVFKGSGRELG